MPSLTVESSKLYPDIADIIKAPEDKYSAAFLFETKLHTTDKDLDVSDGVILNSILIVRDYKNNMADYIEIQLSMHLGTYVYDVYPYLENIELTLITYKQLHQGKKPFSRKERYKAVYMLDKNDKIPTTSNQSKEDMNQNLPIVITLQLLDRSAETVRVKTTQGNFGKKINPMNKDMGLKSFIKSIVSEEVNKILIENQPPIDSISIEEPDNIEQLASVTIPSGTRIVELPELLQEKNIGIFNAGIGNYIQTFGLDPFTYKKTFFVYSLYDGMKYEKAEYKIIFYCPVSSNVSVTEVTYKYQDKVLKVLPHMMPTIDDAKETDLASKGTGFSCANANSFMKKPVELTKDGPKFRQDHLVTRVVFKDREDNLNFAPNMSVVCNQFVLTSEVLKRKGNYVTLKVTNLDPDFIYPGAPCKINYENKDNKVIEMYGVIHEVLVQFGSSSVSMPMSYNSTVIALTSQMTILVMVTDQKE